MASDQSNLMNMSLDEIIRNQRQTKKKRGGAVITNRWLRGGTPVRIGRGAKAVTRGGRVARGGLNRGTQRVLARQRGTNPTTANTSRLVRAKLALQRARQSLQVARRQTVSQSAQRRRSDVREATLMQRRGINFTPIKSRLGSQSRGRGARGRRGGFRRASQQTNTEQAFIRSPRTIQRRGGGLFTMGHPQSNFTKRRRLAMDLEEQRLQMRQERQMRKEVYSPGRWQHDLGRGRGGFNRSRGRRQGQGQQRSPQSLQVHIANSYYTEQPSFYRGGRNRGRGSNDPLSKQNLLREARAIVQALSRNSQSRSDFMG